MIKANYGVGDIVVLREGPLRTARSEGEFKILTVLPEAEGQAQYRVRSQSEGFDRRISSNDIDVEKSAGSRVVIQHQARPTGKEPWLKPASIKIGK